MKYLAKIKRFLWSLLPSSQTRSRKFKRISQPLTIILLAGLGLSSALMIPALSQPEASINAQTLARQGKEFYLTGQLEQAIAKWEQAAESYGLEGDDARRTANLINTATAQQALGLYEDSCESVLQAFEIPIRVSQLPNIDKIFDPPINLCLQLEEDAQSLEQNLPTAGQANNFLEANSSFALLQPLVETPNTISQATAWLRLGDYFTNSNYPQVALTATNLSLQIAEKLQNPRQETAALLSLGNSVRAIADKNQNLYSPKTTALNIIRAAQFLGATKLEPEEKALKPYRPAISYYQEAAETAKTAQLPLNRLKAEMNHLSMLLDIQEFWQNAISELPESEEEFIRLSGISDRDFIQETINNKSKLEFGLERALIPEINDLTTVIRPELDSLPPEIAVTRSGIYARINFAQSLIRQEIFDDNTEKLLQDAVADSFQLDNPAIAAEAKGYLGYFYDQKGQLDEKEQNYQAARQDYQTARQYTAEALRIAPTNEYPEIAYRWHAQLGKILAQENDRNAALASYKASFQTINALRSDLATTSVENIFREYITLLLQETPTADQLKEAREVLELLQITELDNFFRDPCSPVAEEIVSINDVDPNAVVIYPIILEDRIEVIVALSNQSTQKSQESLQLYTTEIPRRQVVDTIDKLLSKIFENPGFAEVFRDARGESQTGSEIPRSPEEIQRSLDEIQKSLDQSLQDDILPRAEEIYDWIIAGAEPLFQENNIKTLVFVLDGPLRNLPMSLLYDGEQYLIEKDYDIVLTSGLRLTNPQPLNPQPIRVLAAGTTEGDVKFGFSEIPEVARELDLIEELFPSTVLKGEEFTFDSLREQLRAADYPIVHLATHGKFGSTSEGTFILSGGATVTEDRYINVKEFDSLLRVSNRRDSQPIELLVLSACQTAKGDDRAILGLAGVAVRAGTQSTIATLWNAEDKAAAQLMDYFYNNLNDNQKISKVEALRDAQLELLRNSEYSHPYYWAPFVFIGNWL